MWSSQSWGGKSSRTKSLCEIRKAICSTHRLFPTRRLKRSKFAPLNFRRALQSLWLGVWQVERKQTLQFPVAWSTSFENLSPKDNGMKSCGPAFPTTASTPIQAIYPVASYGTRGLFALPPNRSQQFSLHARPRALLLSGHPFIGTLIF